jgi:hypothetical protein
MLSLGLGAAPAFGGAGADKIALYVGEASEDGEHQAPGAGAGVGPPLGEGSELRLGVRDALEDGKQVEGAAGEAVNPPHRHHVAGASLPTIRGERYAHRTGQDAGWRTLQRA